MYCWYFAHRGLDVFKFDPNYLENEEKYKEIKAEILGEDSDDESGSGSESDSEDEEAGEYIECPCRRVLTWVQFPTSLVSRT